MSASPSHLAAGWPRLFEAKPSKKGTLPGNAGADKKLRIKRAAGR
jgi:hypothetical protein